MTKWMIIGGAISLVMAYASGRLRRAPLSTSIVYLAAGYVLGPNVLGILDIDPKANSQVILGITEIVIVISIFSGALKLRVPALDRRWLDPARLASLSMVLSAAAVGALAHAVVGASLGAAVLLGGTLAPTDPVLASDVQVEHPFDYEQLRFALTGEAGMNDGTAFPIVTLGLALIGAIPAMSVGHWFLQHVLWGVAGALAIGGVLGHYGGKFMLHLRLVHGERLGTDNFLALGLMGLSFGLAEQAGAIGFVAVFAAGVAVRGIERRSGDHPPKTLEFTLAETGADQEVANDPAKAPAFMLLRLQSFTESLERIGEAVVVVLLGSLLRNWMLTGDALIFAALLFFVVRPLSVFLGLMGSPMGWMDRAAAGWFGIRGMATIYYVTYIYAKGAPDSLVNQIAGIALGVVTYSIILHGVTVTPVMRMLAERRN
jgi:sodium/hydrogen antiporter